MKMTVETYAALPPAEAAKSENIKALLQSDRALYDLELYAKKKLSPAFIEKAMPIIVKERGFEGSFQRYQKNTLSPLSNLKIFYDRLHEYSPKPSSKKEVAVENAKSSSPRM